MYILIYYKGKFNYNKILLQIFKCNLYNKIKNKI